MNVFMNAHFLLSPMAQAQQFRLVALKFRFNLRSVLRASQMVWLPSVFITGLPVLFRLAWICGLKWYNGYRSMLPELQHERPKRLQAQSLSKVSSNNLYQGCNESISTLNNRSITARFKSALICVPSWFPSRRFKWASETTPTRPDVEIHLSFGLSENPFLDLILLRIKRGEGGGSDDLSRDKNSRILEFLFSMILSFRMDYIRY